MTRRAIKAGITTLVAGFGAMNLFAAIEPPTGQRGLYSYWSATLGDAIALPALAAGLTQLALTLETSHQPPRRMVLAGTAAGACLGLATQIAWISDPNPDPNWTLPAPHTFTAAGYYHAAFTIALSGYLAGQVTKSAWLFRKRRQKDMQLDPESRRAGLVSISAMAAFATLALADNLGNRDHSASAASLATLLLVAILIVGASLWVAYKKTPEP